MKTVVSLLENAEFKAEGLRTYFEYRNLGADEATDGKYVARVVRARENHKIDAGWHVHHVDFRMLYILKGWLIFHYKELGTFTLKAGDVIFQAPDPHTELEHSDDLEVLEVATPGDFVTAEAR